MYVAYSLYKEYVVTYVLRLYLSSHSAILLIKLT